MERYEFANGKVFLLELYDVATYKVTREDEPDAGLVGIPEYYGTYAECRRYIDRQR